MGADKAQVRKPKPKWIIRASHNEKAYFLMARATAQDDRLSWAARGMLGYLLSKPDDWRVSIKDLQQGCGRDKVYNLLDELIELRYVVRSKGQSVDYYVYEVPLPENPEVENGLPENPDTEIPDPENTDVYIIQNKEHSTENTIVANKSPRAKKVKEPAPPKEKKPRTPQRTDPLFDAIGKHIFSATTPAAVEAVNFRIGQIIYGDKRRTTTGLIDFESQRQGKSTAELDYNQLAQDVGVFWKNFQKNHPDLDLKDCVKVMEWWVKFRAAQDKQTTADSSGQAGYDENRGVWYRTVDGKREELDPAKGSWEAVA